MKLEWEHDLTQEQTDFIQAHNYAFEGIKSLVRDAEAIKELAPEFYAEVIKQYQVDFANHQHAFRLLVEHFEESMNDRMIYFVDFPSRKLRVYSR